MTSTTIPESPTAASPTEGAPPAAPHRDRAPGLYGPRGWTVHGGVWPLLAQCRDEIRATAIPAAHGLPPMGGIGPDGAPLDDYTPFHDMGPEVAAQLLEILPEDQLEDRQNLSPTLGALLRACAAAGGAVRLSGYGIGPQRPDERVTVEALWVADEDLLDLELSETHDARCRCTEAWARVRERYSLDADAIPDEISTRRRLWDHGEPGTWIWWD